MSKVLLVVGTLLLYAASLSAANLEIHHIDVGQGDCTLIVSPTGGRLLFDGGDTGQGANIIGYLSGIGITSVDYTVASHYHSDHIGGLDEVINGGISILTAAYDRGGSYASQAFDQYVSAVGAKRTTINDGQVIDLGGGVAVKCVAVNGNGVPGASDENDLGVALKVDYGDFDYFVAGDLSGSNDGGYADIETSVAPEVGDLEIYRVDHHGSIYSSNQYFVDTIDPEVSIISVGKNSYGHPSPTVVSRLTATSTLYQTENNKGRLVDGDIVVVTDGLTSFTVNGDYYQMGGGVSYMHVAGISMSIKTQASKKWAVAQVTIVDANNAPVGSATVSGHWSGLTNDTDNVPTGTNGVASISSNKVVNPVGWFIFTVDNLTKSGWVYDSAANVETTDSIYVGGALAASAVSEPNPFSTSTRIDYVLPTPSHTRLAVYDVAGRIVRVLVDREQEAGRYSIEWSGDGPQGAPVPTGIYFFRLESAGVATTGKMFLIRR